MQQHDVDDTTTRKCDQGKLWPLNTPSAREAEDDIQQQTPKPENNTQGLEEQMHYSSPYLDRIEFHLTGSTMIWCDAQKKDDCRISIPDFWLYLPDALPYPQLLFEMTQSVYWYLVLQKRKHWFHLNSFSKHFWKCQGMVLIFLILNNGGFVQCLQHKVTNQVKYCNTAE